jgi:hypothetical protein
VPKEQTELPPHTRISSYPPPPLSHSLFSIHVNSAEVNATKDAEFAASQTFDKRSTTTASYTADGTPPPPCPRPPSIKKQPATPVSFTAFQAGRQAGVRGRFGGHRIIGSTPLLWVVTHAAAVRSSNRAACCLLDILDTNHPHMSASAHQQAR